MQLFLLMVTPVPLRLAATLGSRLLATVMLLILLRAVWLLVTLALPLFRRPTAELPLAMPTLCLPVAVLLREILLQSKETMLPMTPTIPTTSRSETLSCLLTRLF